MLPQHIHVAVKDAVVFAAEGELVQRLPNTQLQDGQGLEVHVGMLIPWASMRPLLALISTWRV